MAVSDLLAGCPLFHEFYPKEVDKIVHGCHVCTFLPEKNIVEDGEIGSQIFLMLQGKARVQKNTKNGFIHIQDLTKGDVFGELVLLGEKKRSADVVATTKCSVLELPFEHVFKLYRSEPKIFGLVLLNISRLLVKKMSTSNDIIVGLKEKKAA